MRIPCLRGRPLADYSLSGAREYDKLMIHPTEEEKRTLSLVRWQIEDLDALSEEAFQGLPDWLIEDAIHVQCVRDRKSWLEILRSYIPLRAPTPPSATLLPLIHGRRALIQVALPWWRVVTAPGGRYVMAKPQAEVPADSMGRMPQSFGFSRLGWNVPPSIEACYTTAKGVDHSLTPSQISIPNCCSSLAVMEIPKAWGSVRLRVCNWSRNLQGKTEIGKWSKPVAVTSLIDPCDAKAAWLKGIEKVPRIPIKDSSGALSTFPRWLDC